MDVHLVPDDNDGLELAQWVRESGLPVREIWAEPRPGELGSMIAVLIVAVGANGMLTVLAQSLAAWLADTHRKSSVRLKVKGPDGTEVELTTEMTTKQVAAALREALNSGDASGN